MKLLVVNSNTSAAITRVIEAQARAVARPETTITCVTARFGSRAIESRAEMTIAAHATLDAFAQAGAFDAGIVACFGDPGLQAARESFGRPIVGVAEAALATGLMLAPRVAVVTVSAGNVPMIEELVTAYGLSGRLASVRALTRSVLDAAADRGETLAGLIALARTAIEEDGAGAIIVGGAALAGLAQALQEQIAVPVLDGVACAVKQAELLAVLASHVPKRTTAAGKLVAVDEVLKKALEG